MKALANAISWRTRPGQRHSTGAQVLDVAATARTQGNGCGHVRGYGAAARNDHRRRVAKSANAAQGRLRIGGSGAAGCFLTADTQCIDTEHVADRPSRPWLQSPVIDALGVYPRRREKSVADQH